MVLGEYMNYMAYYPIDVVNGPGTRCTLFVCGCEHHCEGCYNQSTWNKDAGFLFDEYMENQIIRDLQDTRIHRRGLSLSGGDPLLPNNLDTILSLVKRVKSECPNKDIWLWTGYTYEDLTDKQKEVISYVDIVIDGKYEKESKDIFALYKGSSNQRIIDTKTGMEIQFQTKKNKYEVQACK